MAKPKSDLPAPRPRLIRVTTAKFDSDAKRMAKRGKRIEKLDAIIDLLRTHQPLPRRQADHALTGNLKGWRDCHIEPNWVLIYKRSGDSLTLGRTGTHSDLGID